MKKTHYKKITRGDIELFFPTTNSGRTIIDNLIDFVATAGGILEVENEFIDEGYISFDFQLESPGICRSEEASWGYNGGTPPYAEHVDEISVDKIREHLKNITNNVSVSVVFEEYIDREAA